MRSDKSKSKTIAFFPMFLSILLKIVPKMIRQGIPVRYPCHWSDGIGGFLIFHTVFRVQYGFDNWMLTSGWQGKPVKAESAILTESGNKYSFPVLGNPVPGVNNFPVKVVAQFSESFLYYSECFPLVMPMKILDIFKQNRLWTMVLNDPCYIKKQGSLGFVSKSMRFAKSIFFGNSRN